MAQQMPANAGTLGGQQARVKRGFVEDDEDDSMNRNPVFYPEHIPAQPLPGHSAYVRSETMAAGSATDSFPIEQ